MDGLMVHCGGWEAKGEDLRAVPVPPETESYYPVPYARFLEEVKLHVPRFGLEIASEQFALAREGAQMFGVLTCQASTPAPWGNGDFALAIGLRNSYDRSLPVGLVAGTRVFCCDNLAFSGEVAMARRHTVNVFRDLPDLIYRMLSKVAALNERQTHEFTQMKVTEVSPELAALVMVESVKRDILPVSKLPAVIDCWEEPKHPEFRLRNGWSLYNSFTEVAKSRSPRNQMDSTLALTALFRETVLS